MIEHMTFGEDEDCESPKINHMLFSWYGVTFTQLYLINLAGPWCNIIFMFHRSMYVRLRDNCDEQQVSKCHQKTLKSRRNKYDIDKTYIVHQYSAWMEMYVLEIFLQVYFMVKLSPSPSPLPPPSSLKSSGKSKCKHFILHRPSAFYKIYFLCSEGLHLKSPNLCKGLVWLTCLIQWP